MPTSLGLRERKKHETRRAIAEAALALAVEHGPDVVTVEQIAAAADVSPRTVFNYFGTKDEAILGIDARRRAELVAAVAARPAHESPLTAIRTVMTEVMTANDEPARHWRDRAKLVSQHPHLRAAQLASQTVLESELAQVVADRVGLDVSEDVYPALVVRAGLTALRLALERGSAAGAARLRDEIARAFALLEQGLQPPARPTRRTR